MSRSELSYASALNYASAPLYSRLANTAARTLLQREPALRPFLLRREWPEYPRWDFILCLGLIALGLLSGVLGLAGAFDRGGVMEAATQAHIPVAASDLIGNSATLTRGLFGSPALVRREPPAEVWQYRSDDCVLDLYLYGENQPDKVQHAELRAHEADQTTGNAFETQCLRELRLAATN